MSAPAPVTQLDRMMRGLRSIIRAEIPSETYSNIYEYAVEALSADGSTADATPVDTTQSVPPDVRIPLQLNAMTATLTVGSKCLVAFINGDPTRATILSAAPVPLKATYDASAQLKIGASCPDVEIGVAPAPLATSLGTLTVIGLLTTFVASVTSAAATSVAAGNTLASMGTFVTAVQTAGGVVSTGLAAALALVPTITVKAGP